MEKKIQTIASLKANSFSVYLDDVRLRNGNVTRRMRIDHPEATAIIPFISDNEIIMVKQFRYALGRETLEIPAGKLDPGEQPDDCARRELLEETGYGAGEITLMFTYAPAIGYSNELIHIFSARGLKKMTENIDEREIESLERLSIDRVNTLVKRGLILDGKSLIGLSMMGLIGT